MNAAAAGFLTGLSLIVAVGAQNAYLLRLGLTRQFTGLAVAICAVSDIVLITVGVGGMGGVIHAAPKALDVLRWVGVVYLVSYAGHSFWRARRPGSLVPSEVERLSPRQVALTTLAFTFLNPHVYLDTVLLLGSLGNQYGHGRWLFAAGACAASIAWFCGLGFGARSAARFMSRPATWRLLDVMIGIVMLVVALNVATTHIG